MIWVACLVELLIEDWTDFWILLSLQFINASVSFYEAARAGDAVAALKAALKPAAVAKRDGRWVNLSAALLVPGDLVTLAAGAAVPADCVINGGSLDVDQAALTGESLPVSMGTGDRPKMGSTVSRGEVEASVEFTGARTFFGKTAAMIQSVEQLSNIQRVLIRIMVFLLAISFVLCGICLAYLLIRGEPFLHSIAYVVVLLVASIPIAMEVVTTTTMALGSRELSGRNAIVSRLAAIEELAGMNMLCSDKTGTLTLNKMVIQAHTPTFQAGLTQADVLRYAALAARWNEPPKDALDTLVLTAVDLPSLDAYEQLDYMPFDSHLKRTEALVRAPDGSEFRVTKGAPDVLLRLLPEADQSGGSEAEGGFMPGGSNGSGGNGNGDALSVGARVERAVEELAHRGIRSLAVARTDEEGAWQMLGCAHTHTHACARARAHIPSSLHMHAHIPSSPSHARVSRRLLPSRPFPLPPRQHAHVPGPSPPGHCGDAGSRARIRHRREDDHGRSQSHRARNVPPAGAGRQHPWAGWAA
jgi:H+-transporting ATPase